MSAKSATDRKAAERERKRAQGLVLKQVWTPPEAWPIISELATTEAEEYVHHVHRNGGSYSSITKFSDGIPVEFTYEAASEISQELLARGEAVLGPKSGPAFLRHVIRAMLKTYDASAKADPILVERIREELE